MPKNIYDKPSEVVASDGFVLVDGPGPCAVAFTPEAALETAIRLQQGASDAKDQALRSDQDRPAGSGPA
jgi:hypothetical protein